jgi:hypothetical protein
MIKIITLSAFIVSGLVFAQPKLGLYVGEDAENSECSMDLHYVDFTEAGQPDGVFTVDSDSIDGDVLELVVSKVTARANPHSPSLLATGFRGSSYKDMENFSLIVKKNSKELSWFDYWVKEDNKLIKHIRCYNLKHTGPEVAPRTYFRAQGDENQNPTSPGIFPSQIGQPILQ